MAKWKAISEYFILGLLLIPLIFINHRETHDWGGDFAQYIQQSINIIELEAQSNHHYLYNEEHPMLGPELYPIGFPLVLSPVIATFGNDMPLLILYMNIWLILCGLAFFSVLKLYYKSLPSMALVVLLCYKPYLIIFKSEVMADLPFLFFLLLAFRSYAKKGFDLYTTLLIIMACLIKPYGLSLLVALLFDKLIRKWRTKEAFKPSQVFYFVLAFLLPSLLNQLIFGVPSSFTSYLNNFSFGDFWSTVQANFELYYQPFDNYIVLIDPDLATSAAILSILLFSLLFIGLAYRLYFYGFGSIELFVIIHLAMLILFPSQAQGPRYLLAILPFLFILVNEAFIPMQMRWPFLKDWPIYSLVAIHLVFYLANIPWINQNFSDPLPGPQAKASIECFEYLQKNIDKSDHVVFKKPRVLGLYADIDSYSNEPYQSLEELEHKYSKMGTRYFLTNVHNHNEALEERFIPAHRNELKIVWQNEAFKLYMRTE